ncbi:hypothetical protein BKA82DRAFT_996490 [Pisolithus tinctorius]|uniref:RBR-type E3 ubiquitin transferase n=1 Tax=Pisolithus tinctorius Marx 270 TaxID=870435 RepID=A0A0C3KJA1_PISTI|nr:hypothetical protein BKA82DRAFT_996490 [Pisolithus tinctorius]KIO09657.1 hypothetical protein M404DRAFT_996490 [Pisolithus tinctorius Marx 270]
MATNSSIASDLSSNLLIAHLIDQDLQALTDAQLAETAQLESVLAVSAFRNGAMPRFTRRTEESSVVLHDAAAAMSIFLSDARSASDYAVAEAIQTAQEAAFTAGQQLAQKLAAEETKIALDFEFARRLQTANNNGTVDMDSVRDVESLLGREEVENILAADRNFKGKGTSRSTMALGNESLGGKGKGRMMDVDSVLESPSDNGHDNKTDSLLTPYPCCGICFEPFQATHSPMAASKTATSSSHLNYGFRLPCPEEHPYCQPCLAHYIMSKLAPEGNYNGVLETVVFPIKCPECHQGTWEEGISDEVAERILSEKDMVLWHTQKLFDSMEKQYCPNSRCSALLQVEEDPNDPIAVCPRCQESICVPCKVLWHHDLTCEEFQDLPENERSPDDQSILLMAKAKNWRRCPTCSRLVELTYGCNHITCYCGTHFCHRCGALWDRMASRCTRKPSCELWDENMLLEEQERRQVAERERQQQLQRPARVQALEPPPPYRPAPVEERNDLEWLRNPKHMGGGHLFTSRMIRGLTCGYCRARADSLAHLLYHLEHVRHPVFACCGRFFPREIDFDRHCNSRVKGGRHEHRVVRRG